MLLHATVVNTIYASGRQHDGRGHGPRPNERLSLDAERLIETYRDFIWASDIAVERIDICRMGAEKVLDIEGKDTGEVEYKVIGSKKL